jgi:hypothetical protein
MLCAYKGVFSWQCRPDASCRASAASGKVCPFLAMNSRKSSVNQLPPNIVEFTANFREETDDHLLRCLVTSVAYCHSSSAIPASRTSGEASATMGLPRRWWNLPGVM